MLPETSACDQHSACMGNPLQSPLNCHLNIMVPIGDPIQANILTGTHPVSSGNPSVYIVMSIYQGVIKESFLIASEVGNKVNVKHC